MQFLSGPATVKTIESSQGTSLSIATLFYERWNVMTVNRDSVLACTEPRPDMIDFDIS